MEDNLRNQIINKMISELGGNTNNESLNKGGEKYKFPDTETIKKCKELVNTFLETRNNIKKLQDALKDQKQKMYRSEEDLLQIMSKYGFEELKDDLKHVKLKLNYSKINTPLTTSLIRERLEKIPDIQFKTRQQIEDFVFERKLEGEKPKLKTLKNK